LADVGCVAALEMDIKIAQRRFGDFGNVLKMVQRKE
jgi:hypothetical protein